MFMKNNQTIGAGILGIDKNTGEILLIKRSSLVPNPNKWAVVGGKKDEEDDDIRSAAIREFKEEVQPDSAYKLSKLPFFINENKYLKFYTFLGIFENKFVPVLNEENVDFGWFNIEELPDDLLPACELMFEEKQKELRILIEKIKKG